MKLKGQRIGVIGGGASGLAAARLALQLGADVTIVDSRQSDQLMQSAAPLLDEGAELVMGDAAFQVKGEMDFAILSPGIDPSWEIARHFSDQSVPIRSEIEFAYENYDVPVIAITGTNGKTTTTEIIVALLTANGVKTRPAGNYGHAYSQVVVDREDLDVVTLEVSSFQLELIETFRPKVSVWMNFAADHLDRHPSMEAYRSAKLKIFANQEESDTAVINGRETYPPLGAHSITFSAFETSCDFHLDGNEIKRGRETLIDYSTTQLRGTHNAENLMAAMAATHAWGLDFESMVAAARSYRPPRHRTELVAILDGREYINDSKATNLHALESSLVSQSAPVVLIAGGKEKGLDFSPLNELISGKTTHVVCLGEIGEKLCETWGGISDCSLAGDVDEAVSIATRLAKPGQTVLFSPGTSSFDMFRGYEERGDAFCKSVTTMV